MTKFEPDLTQASYGLSQTTRPHAPRNHFLDATTSHPHSLLSQNHRQRPQPNQNAGFLKSWGYLIVATVITGLLLWLAVALLPDVATYVRTYLNDAHERTTLDSMARRLTLLQSQLAEGEKKALGLFLSNEKSIDKLRLEVGRISQTASEKYAVIDAVVQGRISAVDIPLVVEQEDKRQRQNQVELRRFTTNLVERKLKDFRDSYTPAASVGSPRPASDDSWQSTANMCSFLSLTGVAITLGYLLNSPTQRGKQGLEGPKGEQGRPGPPGPPGPPGVDGDHGQPGPRGNPGSRGLDGQQGPKGDSGLQGPEGPRGPKGETGLAGSGGPPGPRGPTGLQGPPGRDGAAGSQGPRGPRGDPGPRGLASSSSNGFERKDSTTHLNQLNARVPSKPGAPATGDPTRNEIAVVPAEDQSNRRKQPFKLQSINLNRKNIHHDLDVDAVCMQEALYQARAGFSTGYLTQSEDLKTWTRNPHLCLMKTASMLVVTTTFEEKEVVIINVHLHNRPKVRKAELKEIGLLIQNLELLDKHSNLIVCGDFNERQDAIQIHVPLIPNNLPTWRKSPDSPLSSCIGHVGLSQHLYGSLAIADGPGDHSRICARISGFKITEPSNRIVELPQICKKLGDKLAWGTLQYYPKIDYIRTYNGTRCSGPTTEEEFYSTMVQRRENIRVAELRTREDWKVATRTLRIKPISTALPLLNEAGHPVENLAQLTKATLRHLELATGQSMVRVGPRGLDLSKSDSYFVNKLIEDLVTQCKTGINCSKSAGEDGLHPAAVKRLCREAPDNMRQLLRDSLTRNNALSGRVALIPKKDGAMRPIQVLNQTRVQLEKVILQRVNLSSLLNNPDDIFAFKPRSGTHSAILALRDILKEMKRTACTKPVLFVDFRKAYNSCKAEKILDILDQRMDNSLANIRDMIKQIISGDNIRIGTEYYQCARGVPQGSPMSPVLFNLLMDEMVTTIKQRWPDSRVLCFADDLAIVGEVELAQLESIGQDFGLVVNMAKCAAFNHHYPGIPKVKSFKYLGITLRENGEFNSVKELEKLAKQIADRVRSQGYPPKKAYHLATTYIHSKILYQGVGQMPFKLKAIWNVCAKRSLALPVSLPQPTFSAFEQRVKRNSSESLVNTLVGLMRKHDHRVGEQLFQVTRATMEKPLKELQRLLASCVGSISRFALTARRPRARPRSTQAALQDRPVGPERPVQLAHSQIPRSVNLYLSGDLTSRQRQTISYRLRRHLRLRGYLPSFRPSCDSTVEYVVVADDTPSAIDDARRYGKKLLPGTFTRRLLPSQSLDDHVLT